MGCLRIFSFSQEFWPETRPNGALLSEAKKRTLQGHFRSYGNGYREFQESWRDLSNRH